MSVKQLDLVAQCDDDELWFNDDMEDDVLIPLNNPLSITFPSTNIGVEENVLDAINMCYCSVRRSAYGALC